MELSLKWGTLKSWNVEGNEKGTALLKEYYNLGMSFGGMSQKDTPRQKEIICEMIDLCDAPTIYREWDGIDVSKEEAKKYVMEYGKEKEPCTN